MVVRFHAVSGSADPVADSAHAGLRISIRSVGLAGRDLRIGCLLDAYSRGRTCSPSPYPARAFTPPLYLAFPRYPPGAVTCCRVSADQDGRVEVYLQNDEASLAVEAAREVLRLRAFRETGYRLLMRAHRAEGNRAEALRTYERCRELISAELGVSPSRETQALYRELLSRA